MWLWLDVKGAGSPPPHWKIWLWMWNVQDSQTPCSSGQTWSKSKHYICVLIVLLLDVKCGGSWAWKMSLSLDVKCGDPTPQFMWLCMDVKCAWSHLHPPRRCDFDWMWNVVIPPPNWCVFVWIWNVEDPTHTCRRYDWLDVKYGGSHPPNNVTLTGCEMCRIPSITRYIREWNR